jgi:hypothetical protein
MPSNSSGNCKIAVFPDEDGEMYLRVEVLRCDPTPITTGRGFLLFKYY